MFHPHIEETAGERTRTVSIQLGRLMLYQLSYARMMAVGLRLSAACTRAAEYRLA